MNKTGGCSPLEIVFKNTTTGASAAARYKWDFDNGNSSTLQNPSATYITERTYTITLEVTDGGNKSTATETVTVYQKPLVDFSASPGKGCAPLTVNFTSAATTAQGSIVNYLWDFGDGHTVEGPTLDKTAHIYAIPQKPPVNLTVTNSLGCYASVNKTGFVEIYPKLTAEFTPSTSSLCGPGAVSFDNTSAGEGHLSYSWDFGDGKSSTAKSPVHDYTTSGKFSVRLTVKNEVGCSVTAKVQTVSVSAYNADFSVPPLSCTGQITSFLNKSPKPYKDLQWFVNGEPVTFSQSTGNMNYRFPAAGSHTVKLRVDFNDCVDSVTKRFKVGTTPDVKGFLVSADDPCSLPVTYTFTDTTPGAKKWIWRYHNNAEVFDSTRKTTLTLSENGSDNIGLLVTNADGCSSEAVKEINYHNTDVAIVIKSTNGSSQSANRGCPGLSLQFSTTPPQEVVSFRWKFGDGSTSTKPEPTYTYKNYGSYQVTLEYTSRNGCKGTVTYDSIYINDVKPVDFGVSPSPLICGNSKVTFTPGTVLPNRDYIWLVNGAQAYFSLSGGAFEHRFEEAGVYTISLIVQSGSCRDTVTKVDYVTVVAPFPQIKSVQNTCQGQRGEVTFQDTSKGATKWTWDFGDGDSLSYNSFKPAVSHNYSQTGTYKVKLTVVNGSCQVADSVFVPVLLKQDPRLMIDAAQLCTSDSPSVTLSNLQWHPVSGIDTPYQVAKIEFGDLSASKATLITGNWDTSFTGTIYGLETAKEDLRIITTSAYFGCMDTTNFVRVKVTGPIAKVAFEKVFCLKDSVILVDSSYSDPESPIVSKEWLYAIGPGSGTAGQDHVMTQFEQPGMYPIGLRVTDKNGCSHQTPADSVHMVRISGPGAGFEASSYSVFENSIVDFKNTSTWLDNCELEWHFSDGSITSDKNTSFLFEKEGQYPVKLIATNLETGCSDTSVQSIDVKKLQSLFTYEIIYTTMDNCPPLLVNLKSSSVNASRVSWSFGDGGEGGNQLEVNHVYTSAGTYPIVHYSYDDLGRADSAVQFLVVKGPRAVLEADTLFGCKQLKVELRAKTFDAVSFKWDFGDGVVIPTTDTFATHTYLSPGIYTPSLILTDSVGCSAPSPLGSQVILDSLQLGIVAAPNLPVCDSGIFQFGADVQCFSTQRLQAPVTYNWTSPLHPNTISQSTASWNYNKTGVHDVYLEVSSAYGCNEKTSTQVEVKQGVIAGISGKKDVCIGDSIYLEGFANPPGDTLTWAWQLGNGVTSDLQNPLPFILNTAGQHPVSLEVTNGYCKDNAVFTFNNHRPPSVSLQASKPYTCLGDTVSLRATGGTMVQWLPKVIHQSSSGHVAIANPTSTGSFTSIVSDSLGCSTTDSVQVDVIQPFLMQAPTNLLTCYGTPIQLKVSGAHSYEWTGNGLNSGAPDPIVQPLQTSTYQVVGFDRYNCFTDTASVLVNVGRLPGVNAGPDRQSVAGEELLLSTSYSSDVVKWSWQPAAGLSCATCSDTKAKPEFSTNYVVTVTSDLGCVASDTVRVEMLCGSNYIHVPTAFTPNGDNLNDRFNVRGSGITIKRLAIFDRWGKVVFERRDASAFDRNSGWDGTCNGQPAASGGYVYLLEAVCEKGETFTYKGTVTLIR